MTQRRECPLKADGVVPESLYLPEELPGRHHEANECPGTYDLARYRRPDGSIAVLCSCCYLTGDVRLDEVIEI